MAKVIIGRSVSANYKIWRYIPLDGLINLLSNSTLSFTPLQYYYKSDPFEGLIPKVAFEFLSGVFRDEYKELENAFKQVKDFSKYQKNNGIVNPVGENMIDNLDRQMKELKTFTTDIYKKVVARISVNCWHINEFESEAMWKIYSDSGKGIAIQSTVGLLETALHGTADENVIKIGTIKYIDFYDENLKASECIVDGTFMPLLKRRSYSHEAELRAFITPSFDYKTVQTNEPTPINVKVDLDSLIERICVSPFAKESFYKSVVSISKKYGLDSNIIKQSQLLSGADDLVNMLEIK